MDKEQRLKKNLRYSMLDGAFWCVMTGFSENYISPYAIAMKATSAQIGLLTSVPNLVSSLAQLKSADVTERLGARKRIISIAVFMHALLFLPILLLPYIPIINTAATLILLVTLLGLFGSFAHPAWVSLMGDILPEGNRGEYFGMRGGLGIITICSSLFAGLILHRLSRTVFQGFSIIFTIAMAARFISWYFLTKMHEPEFSARKEDYFRFRDFIKSAMVRNFGKFSLYVSFTSFAVNLSAPFFAVYMLKDLKFTYIIYTTIVTAASLSGVVSSPWWGKRCDRVGNIRVLNITARFIPLIPILWLFSHNVFYLILIQLFAGFIWAGFNLSCFNFGYDAVTPKKRTRALAYFNVVNGTAIFLGALLGGILAPRLPSIFGFKLLTLFLVSGILRQLIVICILPSLKSP